MASLLLLLLMLMMLLLLLLLLILLLLLLLPLLLQLPVLLLLQHFFHFFPSSWASSIWQPVCARSTSWQRPRKRRPRAGNRCLVEWGKWVRLLQPSLQPEVAGDGWPPGISPSGCDDSGHGCGWSFRFDLVPGRTGRTACRLPWCQRFASSPKTGKLRNLAEQEEMRQQGPHQQRGGLTN